MVIASQSTPNPTSEFLESGDILAPVSWIRDDLPVPYGDAVKAMEARVASIRAGTEPEMVWLLEHPALYTRGASAKLEDLLDPDRLPVHETGRGGQYTYHGPGQLIAYTMLDLNWRGSDVRRYVADLEDWIIKALASFGVRGERRQGRVGIWVARNADAMAGREDKIAAIGVRVRRWVAYHGIALNVEPDLTHYDGIVPCGVAEHGITSLVDLGHPVTMDEAASSLKTAFEDVFGRKTSIQD